MRVTVPLVLAAILATAAMAGCSSEQPRSGKPLHAPATFDPSLAGWIACSKLIIEGDVVRVSDASPGRMVTELAVRDWIKPPSGPKTAKIETADIAAEGVYERWEPGTRLFLQVDVDPSSLPSWQFGGRMIKKIKHAVPASRSIECPYGPS